MLYWYFNSHLFTAPSAPLNLDSMSLTSTSEMITWSLPKHPNGMIRNYVLFYWKVAEGKDSYNPMIANKSSTTLSAILRDLEESVRYNVSVRTNFNDVSEEMRFI